MSKERMEELERKSVCVKRKDGRVRERERECVCECDRARECQL